MGIVVLADDTVVPFPSRLMTALAKQEIKRGSDRGIWEELLDKFFYSGNMLEFSELNSEEFVAFKHGIEELERLLADVEIYDGFTSDGLKRIIVTLKSSFAH